MNGAGHLQPTCRERQNKNVIFYNPMRVSVYMCANAECGYMHIEIERIIIFSLISCSTIYIFSNVNAANPVHTHRQTHKVEHTTTILTISNRLTIHNLNKDPEPFTNDQKLVARNC